MLKSLYQLILVALAGVVVGCVRSPDQIGLVVSARQAKAEYLGLKIRRLVPMAGVEAKWNLDQKLDAYLRLQGVSGTVSDQDPILHGNVHGQLFSGEVGLDYFPLPTRAIGLKLGAELFSANYNLRGSWGPVRLDLDDQLIGAGLNLGLVGEVLLTKNQRWQLFWGAGYHFTESWADNTRVDLDGGYALIGVKISLGKKEKHRR